MQQPKAAPVNFPLSMHSNHGGNDAMHIFGKAVEGCQALFSVCT
jgi:hypothetical protein